MAKRDDLSWQDVDTDGFKGPVAKAYKELKDARAVARAATAKFEDAFRKVAGSRFGDGMSCLISHKFGKMSIAIVPEDETKTETKKGKFTI